MEILETYKHLKINYGELGNILKKLDFKEKKTDKFIAFLHTESGAIVVLSKKRKNALVFPPLFASATNTLYLHGITEKKEDLPNMILKERALKKEKKAKAAA